MLLLRLLRRDEGLEEERGEAMEAEEMEEGKVDTGWMSASYLG